MEIIKSFYAIIFMITKDAENPEYVVDGDMLVYGDYEGDQDELLGEAISNPIRLWPKTGSVVIIPYTVPEGLSSHQQTQIDKAIDEYNSKTCLR